MDTADEKISWIEYQPTADDFIDAQRLHQTLKWRTLLFAAFAGAAGGSTFGFFSTHNLKLAAITFLVCLPLLFILGYAGVRLALWILLPWQARRAYDQYPRAHDVVRFALTSEALLHQSEHGESRYSWSDFVKWRFNEKVVLAYIAPNLFVPIPTRLADLSFPLEDLKTALARKLGSPG